MDERDFEKVMDSRFSPEIHRILKESRVGIAGLGGLGSHIAVMLARTGVGHLHLVDFDTVDLSNLNRQEYRVSQLGRPKTEALKEYLLEINPYLDITLDQTVVTEENAAVLFEKDQLICEAFDRPDNKAMLVNALLEQRPDKFVVSGSGMAGYESGNMIKTRKITNRFYLCGDGVTDIEDGMGLMAPRVSICAGHQANMAVRLLLGLEEA